MSLKYDIRYLWYVLYLKKKKKRKRKKRKNVGKCKVPAAEKKSHIHYLGSYRAESR